MRSTLLAPLLLGLPGCLFVVDRHTEGGDLPDSDVVVDSSVPETGSPSSCDEKVRHALRSLPGQLFKTCGTTWVATSVTEGRNELTLQLWVDTRLPGADGSLGPIPPGGSVVVDLATAPPSQGLARLALGAGQYAAACGGPPAGDAEHVWLGVEGRLEVVAAGPTDPATGQPAVGDSMTVTTRGLVVEDAGGSRCRVPDTAFTTTTIP